MQNKMINSGINNAPLDASPGSDKNAPSVWPRRLLNDFGECATGVIWVTLEFLFSNGT